MTKKVEPHTFTLATSNGVSDLLYDNFMYEVPPYQRDFSWQQKQLNQLWHDLMWIKKTEQEHYFGHMVFSANGSSLRTVVDGQQRLTTLILLAVAANNLVVNQAKKPHASGNESLGAGVRNFYMVHSAGRLSAMKKRLVLNQRNKEHFEKILTMSGCPAITNLDESNSRLNAAFNFFLGKLKKFPSKEEMLRFVMLVMEKLLVTVLTVDDENAAYRLFESLNMYGTRLTNADLIKNHIFSTAENVSLDFLDYAQVCWADIQQVGSDNVHAFIRDVFILTEPKAGKDELLKIVKKRMGCSEQMDFHLGLLRSKVDLYLALQNQSDDYWKSKQVYSEDRRRLLADLRLIAGKTYLPLLMAVHFKFTSTEFINFIELLLKFLVRSIIVYNLDNQRNVDIMNKLAVEIWNGEKPFSFYTRKLKSLTPTDDEFKACFAVCRMSLSSNGKLLKYLLYTLESYKSGRKIVDSLSVEHVLPFSPTEEWLEYFGHADAAWNSERIGNYALLTRSDNMNVGRKSFDEKRIILSGSGYKIAQMIGACDRWNLENLNKHQKSLARTAVKIW